MTTDNIAPNAKCQRVLLLALCLVLFYFTYADGAIIITRKSNAVVKSLQHYPANIDSDRKPKVETLAD